MLTNRQSARFAALVLTLVAVPTLVAAQTSVAVTATVSASVTISATGTSLNLGTVNPGSSSAVAAASGAQVSAVFNTSTVTFSMPDAVTLTRTGSGETLSASIVCALKQGSGSIGSCPAAGGSVFSVPAAYGTSGGTHGSAFATAIVYAGASVSPSTTARAGVYTGTFSITVANSGT
jgi:hypothetical protein